MSYKDGGTGGRRDNIQYVIIALQITCLIQKIAFAPAQRTRKLEKFGLASEGIQVYKMEISSANPS